MKQKSQTNQKARFNPFQTISFSKNEATTFTKFKMPSKSIYSNHLSPSKTQTSPSKYLKIVNPTYEHKTLPIEQPKKHRIFSISSFKYNQLYLEAKTQKKIEKFLHQEFLTNSYERVYYPKIKPEFHQEEKKSEEVKKAHINLFEINITEQTIKVEDSQLEAKREEIKIEEGQGQGQVITQQEEQKQEELPSLELKNGEEVKEEYPDRKNSVIQIIGQQMVQPQVEDTKEQIIVQTSNEESSSTVKKVPLLISNHENDQGNLKVSEIETQATPNSSRKKTPDGASFRLIESILRRSPRSTRSAMVNIPNIQKQNNKTTIATPTQTAQKEIKQILKIIEDPKKHKLKVNMTTAQSDLKVIQRLIEKNEWIKTVGMEGDLLWTTKIFTPQQGPQYINFVNSRIPGMKQLSNKKSTSYYLKKSSEFFPDLYNFYPKTYTLPDDFKEFHNAFKENSQKIYIAKPDKGTQGLGIFIVTQITQLFDNESLEIAHLKKQYIIQEYIERPLLIDRKKFDLRLYVVVTSLNPLIIYLNEEGLARFCTDEYQDPTISNAENVYMHLTNYHLNKSRLLSNNQILIDSNKFILQPEDFLEINSATKRTYTSLKKSMQQAGLDVIGMKKQIEDIILKFLYSMQSHLIFNLREVFQEKWEQARCFHILGFDILLDSNLRPWILEVNANPSLDITQEIVDDNGNRRNEVSQLDLFVKTKVVEDAILLAMKSTEEQLKTIGKGRYFNSYKMIGDGVVPFDNIDIFDKMIQLFGLINGYKFGPLKAQQFSKLAKIPCFTNENVIKCDYDLAFKKILLKQNTNEMNFIQFIEAIELVAEKLLKKKVQNYTKLVGCLTILNKALEYLITPQFNSIEQRTISKSEYQT